MDHWYVHSMGWISKLFVQKVIDAAGQLRGLSSYERAALFRKAGVDARAPVDPKSMIADSDFFGLLERIAQDGPHGRSVAIWTGASMRCDDYGAFGLAFKSAADLAGSYRRVERFGKVVTSVSNFRLVPTDGSFLMEVIPDPRRRLGLTMTNELAVSAAVALSREVSSGAFAPAAVHLRASRPADERAYQAIFRCPVHFGADRDALEVSAETAARENRLSDTGMAQFFEVHLSEQLNVLRDDTWLERRILDLIGECLSEGVPVLAEVAGRLGMSSRTLQRRLADAGLAYQDLVADARRVLSERLLTQTDYALAEIAFLTGFSGQSTFTRAFKRWHGQTPACYRRKG